MPKPATDVSPHGPGRARDRRHRARTVGEPHSHAEVVTLALAYGLAGFGYIVTATFLPVIARAALPGSAWLDLFWPIFGVGAVLGALPRRCASASAATCAAVLAGRLPDPGGRHRASALLAPTSAGFALGSFLLGLPFTAITYFAMQEVRRLRPLQMSSTTGLVTVGLEPRADARALDGRRCC